MTSDNRWESIPDMLCPRICPAVFVTPDEGKVIVFGGRNAKQVELKSVEVFDPQTNQWILMAEGMRKKRWAAQAVGWGQGKVMIVGGKGKWVGNEVELLDYEKWEWSVLEGVGLSQEGKSYSVAVVNKPIWDYQL